MHPEIEEQIDVVLENSQNPGLKKHPIWGEIVQHAHNSVRAKTTEYRKKYSIKFPGEIDPELVEKFEEEANEKIVALLAYGNSKKWYIGITISGSFFLPLPHTSYSSHDLLNTESRLLAYIALDDPDDLMSFKKPAEHGTITKKELIDTLVYELKHTNTEYFITDVNRFLRSRIEPTDNEDIFEYWQRASGSFNIFWREISNEVFIVKEIYTSSLHRMLENYIRSVTIDIAIYDEDTTEDCLNLHGYTLHRTGGKYHNIDSEFGSHAKGMIAVFLASRPASSLQEPQ